MNMLNVGRVHSHVFRFLVLILSLLWSSSQLWAAQGRLETPTPGSFQSGIGLIRGWVCSANRVDIEINSTIVVQAVYGEERGDTQITCGDTNNGFSVQVNWNELGEGAHTVRALADGEEFGRATVMVATLGQTFFLGAQGEFPVQPFPQSGQTTRLRWQESRQQFVLSTGVIPANGGNSPRADAKLEDPQPGSFQSGVGLVRGWICTATRIEGFIDGHGPIAAVYQEPRGDTQPACGDSNNGFSIQVNWNDLGDGPHTVRVLADGSEIGQATFTVVTLGLGSFPLGLVGSFTLPNFPKSGFQTSVAWQESQQNFVVTGARFQGIAEGLCKTQQGQATDNNGGQATIQWSNPCLLSGNLAVLHVQVPRTAAALTTATALTVSTGEREQRAASTGSFFLCATSVSVQQQSRIFGASDFHLVDLAGNEVCRELPAGSDLNVILQVEAQSDLNFNAPFLVRYNNQPLVEFSSTSLQQGAPVLNLSAAQIDFTVAAANALAVPSPTRAEEEPHGSREERVQEGSTQDKTFTITNNGTSVLLGGMTLIASGSGGNVFSLVSGDILSLNPGQSQVVKVRYTAVDNSLATGSVRISTNAGVKSVLLRGGGQSAPSQPPPPQPRLVASPSSVNFRPVEIQQTRDESFIVINSGSGTLTGSVSASAPFAIVSGGTFNLAAGQNQTVVVRFAPTAGGNFTANATVTSNSGTDTVKLSGVGIKPELCLDPATLTVRDFGTVNANTTKNLTVTVKNCGNGTLIGSVATTVPFSVVSGGSFTLAENQSQTVTLRFAPTTTGSFTANATLTSNNGSLTVQLLGVSVNPLCVEPVALDFGSVSVGSSKELTVIITNCGVEALAGSIETAAPFSLVTSGSFNLVVKQTTRVTVKFSPQAAGKSTRAVHITFESGQTLNVNLAGEGIDMPKLCASDGPLEFGTVELGVDKDLSFTVKNCGTGSLTGTVTTAAPFSIVGGGQLDLTEGQTQTVTARFTPTGEGTFSNNAQVTTNGGSANVKLMGSGIREPKLCVTPTLLDFGTVSVSGDSFKSLDFTIKNCGGGLLSGSFVDPCPSGDCPTPFSVSSRSDLNFNLNAGESRPITVDFSPSGNGSFNDSIPVNSNGGTVEVKLQGTGAFPPTPPTISNIRQEFTRLNDCTIPEGTGSSFTIRFDYSDPNGDANTVAGATVVQDLRFSNGDTSSLDVTSSSSFSGDGFSGTVSSFRCTRFGDKSSFVDRTFTLKDGAGHPSNTLTVRSPRPEGGQ